MIGICSNARQTLFLFGPFLTKQCREAANGSDGRDFFSYSIVLSLSFFNLSCILFLRSIPLLMLFCATWFWSNVIAIPRTVEIVCRYKMIFFCNLKINNVRWVEKPISLLLKCLVKVGTPFRTVCSSTICRLILPIRGWTLQRKKALQQD